MPLHPPNRCEYCYQIVQILGMSLLFRYHCEDICVITLACYGVLSYLLVNDTKPRTEMVQILKYFARDYKYRMSKLGISWRV